MPQPAAQPKLLLMGQIWGLKYFKMKAWPLPQTSQSSPEPLPCAGRRPDHFRIINSFNPLVQVSEVCPVLTPILRIGKLRHREVERFALGHTAGKLQAQEGTRGW